MENHAIVRPEHLNHHGFLFGGQLLKWVDEFAWMAASKEFHHCRMVTVGMDQVVFREKILLGAILRFAVERERKGRSSVTYKVVVWSDEEGADREKEVFSTRVTLVRVDEKGNKTPLP